MSRTFDKLIDLIVSAPDDWMTAQQTKPASGKSATDGMKQIDLQMTNFDLTIDAGFADALRAQPGAVWGAHAAWNFHGRVWCADGQFHEEVWQYREIKEVMSASTLETLMDKVNSKYGSE